MRCCLCLLRAELLFCEDRLNATPLTLREKQALKRDIFKLPPISMTELARIITGKSQVRAHALHLACKSNKIASRLTMTSWMLTWTSCRFRLCAIYSASSS